MNMESKLTPLPSPIRLAHNLFDKHFVKQPFKPPTMYPTSQPPARRASRRIQVLPSHVDRLLSGFEPKDPLRKIFDHTSTDKEIQGILSSQLRRFVLSWNKGRDEDTKVPRPLFVIISSPNSFSSATTRVTLLLLQQKRIQSSVDPQSRPLPMQSHKIPMPPLLTMVIPIKTMTCPLAPLLQLPQTKQSPTPPPALVATSPMKRQRIGAQNKQAKAVPITRHRPSRNNHILLLPQNLWRSLSPPSLMISKSNPSLRLLLPPWLNTQLTNKVTSIVPNTFRTSTLLDSNKKYPTIVMHCLQLLSPISISYPMAKPTLFVSSLCLGHIQHLN